MTKFRRKQVFASGDFAAYYWIFKNEPCSGKKLMFQTPRGRLGVWRFETRTSSPRPPIKCLSSEKLLFSSFQSLNMDFTWMWACLRMNSVVYLKCLLKICIKKACIRLLYSQKKMLQLLGDKVPQTPTKFYNPPKFDNSISSKYYYFHECGQLNHFVGYFK